MIERKEPLVCALQLHLEFLGVYVIISYSVGLCVLVRIGMRPLLELYIELTHVNSGSL